MPLRVGGQTALFRTGSLRFHCLMMEKALDATALDSEFVVASQQSTFARAVENLLLVLQSNEYWKKNPR